MTADLAERVGRWAFQFAPSAAHTARIRASIRDFLGCVTAGTRRPELQSALWLAHGGAVPVCGLADSFDPAGAALIAGTAGSLLQLHDVYVPAGLHPSSPVIPAAWSALHSLGARRRNEFVRAVAVGYEVANRFGAACAPQQALAGSSGTGTAGALGAATAAAIVAGMDAAGIAAALSNAALMLAATPVAAMRAHGSVVPLHSGIAARCGFEAASVARAGSAGRYVLEGDVRGPGLLGLLQARVQQLVPENWHGETIDDVSWKFYPACFASLACIEATLQIRPLVKGTIRHVTLYVPDRMLALVACGPNSDELYDRLMSLRWVVARALDCGEYNIACALESSASTLALAQRIQVIHAPELDALLPKVIAADVSVETDRETRRVAYRRPVHDDPPDNAARGWTRALDEQALHAKFKMLVGESQDVTDTLRWLLTA